MGKIRKAKESSTDENPRKKFKKDSPHKKKGPKGKNEKPESTSSPAASEEKWSKSKKKRMRKLLGKLKKGTSRGDTNQTAPPTVDGKAAADSSSSNLPETTTTKSANNKKSNSIQAAFKARLAGSRFRILNEELYTTTSQTSYDKFKASPELFEQYHEGFRHQVESWPENPVDVIVRSLTSTYNNKKGSSTPCVVADFGCGDAQLAKDLLAVKKKKENVFKVHSFDLVSPNELVTACDMADVPLEDKSVDVCVFCLSLMGTNLADFIREAHRVLKDDGRVKIAEVRSRIEYSHGRKGKQDNKNKDASSSNDTEKEKTEGTLEEFTGVLEKLGFKSVRTDRTNTMFLLLELKKNGKKPDKKLEFSAKPCIYKRR
jgi:ubiquinone/menaquinone biosynthesis C-methylase UbiE